MKKSIFLFFAAILCAVSVSAGDGFYGIYIKYHQNGQNKTSDGEWTSPLNVGTLTTDFKITDVYLKVWWADWTPSPVCGQLHYWKDGTEVWPGLLETVKSTGGNNREIYAEGWNYVLASPTEASGKHEITYKWEAYLGSVTHTLPSNGTKKITYTVLPPNPKTISCTSNGDGLGTEDSPFQVPLGKTLTISVNGTQNHVDANSVLHAKFADAYTSNVSHDIIPTTTKQSITITAKYYNATDKLSSSKEKSITVYYQAVEEENHDVLVAYKYGETVLLEEATIEKVGISTATPVTAPAITGYTFSSWNLGSGVQSADDATTNPINITTKSGETDYTLVANYNEDLTSGWTLKGSFVDDFATAYDFTKKSGESTGKIAYTTLGLDAHKEYHFKVVNDSTWYGNNNYNEGDETWWIKTTMNDPWEFYSDAGNCYMKTGLAGTYTFKIDYSGTYPKVSIYYPEIYAIVGSFNEWNENTNPLVFNGNEGTTTINLQASATNYEFKVIDNAVHGGMTSKTITQTESNMVIIVGGGDNIQLTANAYPSGNYIFTYDKSTKKLSVKYPNVYSVTATAENGTVEGAREYAEGATVTLTATANTGYQFVNWTKDDEEVSTNAIYSFTVTENVDLVANFEALPPTITEYTRDVPVGYYATMCLPYASSNYTGVEIYEVAWMEFKDDKAVGLYLDQVVAGTTLEAGKPYIFKATAAQQEFVYEGKEVTEPVNGANGLRGTLTGIAAGNITNHYIIADNKFWVATADNYLVANRAYIDATAVKTTEPALIPNRRRVSLSAAGENTETGIEDIITTDKAVKVIENGQLIIIRDGKKYNAMGVKL